MSLVSEKADVVNVLPIIGVKNSCRVAFSLQRVKEPTTVPSVASSLKINEIIE